MKLDYSFDPALYQRGMKIVVRDFSGAPQLWDAATGERRPLRSQTTGDRMEVDIPFDTGPAVLLIWTEEPTEDDAPAAPTHTLLKLPDTWRSTLETTLDNRYGDFAKPNFEGAPPVQTWRLSHHIETEPD
jgi:hypothetical protein